MQILVLSIAALVPLVITPGLLFHFDITPKIAILLVGVILMLRFGNQNVNSFRGLIGTHPGKWLAILLVVEVVSAVLSTVLSTNRAISLNGGIWRQWGLLSETALLLFTGLTAGWLAGNRQRIQALLRALAAAGVLASLYGICQYFSWDPLLPAKSYEVGEGVFMIVRPPGTLGHADYFGSWLLVVVFSGAALHGWEQESWRKIAAVVAAVLAGIAIVLSGTRSAMLGLVIGGFVYLFLRRPRMRASAIAIAVVAVAAAAFFFSAPGTRLRARLHWAQEDPLGGARLLLWRDSLRMSSLHPLVGFGPETFTTQFPLHESLELARGYPDFIYESPHNVFLDALVERGAPGMAALAGLCILGLWAGYRSAPRKSPAAAGLVAGFVAALICQQFIAFTAATELGFYLLIVMMVAMAAPAHGGQETPPAMPYRFLPPVELAVSLLLAAFATRLVVAEYALARTRAQIESGNVRAAAASYRVVSRWRPSGASADLWYSRSMMQAAGQASGFNSRVEALEYAVESGIRATSTAEDPQNAWYNLAIVYAARGDAAGVERSLRSASASAPNWFKPHWILAQFLQKAGRHEEAIAEAAAAVERDGGRDPEVAATWAQLTAKKTPHP